MRNRLFWALIALLVGGIMLALVLARPQTAEPTLATGGKLSITDKNYSFGEIAMKDGDVSHSYRLTNDSKRPVTVTKLYTSCMCTKVEILKDDNRLYGPFGMQGHGTIPEISVPVMPGESVEVLAVFDPAAHGSAGLGNIERTVFVETGSNPRMELTFDAKVRP